MMTAGEKAAESMLGEHAPPIYDRIQRRRCGDKG